MDEPIERGTLYVIDRPEFKCDKPLARAVFLEPAEDILDLLEFGDDSAEPPRSLSASELERTRANSSELERELDAHTAWLEEPRSGRRLILRDVVAAGADLQGRVSSEQESAPQMSGAIFAGAKSIRTEIEDARLMSAQFEGAAFDAASLVRCNLERASFFRVRVVRTRFIQGRMEQVMVDEASVGGRFREVSLVGASLTRSHLRGTFVGDLRSCDFPTPICAGLTFAHPDGHPDQIGPEFPEHHASPHVHAKNAQGDELIVTYPSGS